MELLVSFLVLFLSFSVFFWACFGGFSGLFGTFFLLQSRQIGFFNLPKNQGFYFGKMSFDIFHQDNFGCFPQSGLVVDLQQILQGTCCIWEVLFFEHFCFLFRFSPLLVLLGSFCLFYFLI